MHYVVNFDKKYEIDPYLDWLNSGECRLPIAQTKAWEIPTSYKVILSLQEDKIDNISDFFECGSLNVVSKRLKNLLESTAVNIEFVPVKLMCGMQNLEFFALHVMRRIKAINETNSIFSGKKYGLVTGIEKLVLNSSLIQNEDLFFLDDAYRVVLIASESVKEKLLAMAITGVQLGEIDQYSDQSRI
ncbi:imm11 family protein [Undibacterium umbellatum]|uniref:Immunity MXAN-0049 protein domain-containing protein n=1 Tax=Undibacterium umbellatum TaxID=2762300 RepID=A0ABR6ZJM6_9BURK|nr:DUF1629 domain-containing protein [Undibacterium umbellatum]MBC3911560.1 hypothetical protein [Undibacterium umbellatum]